MAAVPKIKLRLKNRMIKTLLNPLRAKPTLSYLKIQFVPRNKHFPFRL